MTMPAVLLTDQVRLRFIRTADRYAHAVDILCAESWQPLLESEEGADQDLWPGSPPLRELHVERRSANEHVALLVGMAGSSHWSLSCAVSASGTLHFEAACRLVGPAEWLGSRYRILTPAMAYHTPTGVAWEGGGRLTAASGSGSDFALDEKQKVLSIAARSKGDAGRRTIRWAYDVAV